MLVLLLILFAPYLLPAEWGLTAFMSNLGLFGRLRRDHPGPGPDQGGRAPPC